MKSFSFAKALTLGCLVCLTLPVACGDDDDGSPSKPSGGSANGGAGATDAGGPADGGTPGAVGGGTGLPDGLSDEASTAECGTETCESVAVAGGAIYVDPCCAGTNACGVSTGFLGLIVPGFPNACSPKDQPGDVDEACPAAEDLTATVPLQGQMISVKVNPLVGCCRPSGTCGVVLNDVTSSVGPLGSFGLGCVDGAPFFGGETTSCGAGGGGNGGAGGMGAGGEPTTAGGAGGAGGAP